MSVSAQSERRLRGASRIQLLLLRAGARLIRAVDPEHAWYWTSRLTVVLRTTFRSRATTVFRVFGCRWIEVSLADDYWLPAVLLRDENEPEILAVLTKVLTPGSVFIDVGANIGWWSLFASTVIPDPARIIAIEPAAHTFADLHRNAELNGGPCTLLQAAAWRSAGESLPLVFDRRAREAAHVAWPGTLWSRPSGHTEMVPSVALDDVLDAHRCDGRPVIVKLDVEGAELPALEGLQQHLGGIDLLIYEDHGKDPRARVTERILALGFMVFTADRQARLRPIGSAADARAVKRSPRLGYNFFAVRPGSAMAALLGHSGGSSESGDVSAVHA